MRLRKIKGALNKLIANEKYYINNPIDHRGKWVEVFNNSNPIHIEIGCGKGKFITTMALNNPNINFIAIEKYDSVLLRASELSLNYDLNNLKLVLLDAENILDVFGKNEVDLIYLNFSDPWPKKRYYKRRLTAPGYLEKYAVILKNGGAIYQKTDNRSLFEYSIENFCNEGWLLNNVSLDLHNDQFEGNVTTEFEEKWSKLGPIYRLEARKRKEE